MCMAFIELKIHLDTCSIVKKILSFTVAIFNRPYGKYARYKSTSRQAVFFIACDSEQTCDDYILQTLIILFGGVYKDQ